MSLFDHDDYKQFVERWLGQLPSGKRGQFRRMALHLRVHPTLMSQIFRGSRDLTLEQAFDLATYLKLTEVETEYFLTLVGQNRAGSERLRQFLKAKRVRMARRAKGVPLAPAAE